jgi:hypothetical protein
MAKEKATITLDRAKAAEAQMLVGAMSTSAVVDIALDRLIRAEQIRHDVAGYRQIPQGEADVGIAASGDFSVLDDDTDWAALYDDLT